MQSKYILLHLLLLIYQHCVADLFFQAFLSRLLNFYRKIGKNTINFLLTKLGNKTQYKYDCFEMKTEDKIVICEGNRYTNVCRRRGFPNFRKATLLK